MALVAFEGFDHYNGSGPDILNRRGGGFQWNAFTTNGSAPGFITPGRNGAGSAFRIGFAGLLLGTLTAPLASAYFGFGFRMPDPAPTHDGFMQLTDQAANVVHLKFEFIHANASIQVTRGDGTLLGQTPNNSLTLNAWNFLEFFVTISGTLGAVHIRSNGQDVLNLSGIDTRNGGSAQFDGASFTGGFGPGGGETLSIDDFYVNDTTTGPGLFPMNYFAGDIRVVTLHAVGDFGTPGWTPLTGTNWSQIVEAHGDGDASYNSTGTVGASDRFNFEALAATISNVIAVQVTGAYRKDDAGTRIVTQLLESGGTEVGGAAYSIPTSYVYCSDLWTVDPNTGSAWTLAAVNALKAGYTLIS